LLYDYYGFPPASYDIKYPARNNTELVNKARELLKGQGFSSKIDMKRAFDHGVFVPLKLMFPNADIPVVQISLPRSRDPQVAYQMGLALKPLRDEGVLIIGSGLSFHNLEAFFSSDRSKLSRSQRFDTGLQEIMGDSIDRQRRLVAWEQLPEARYCHPAEDHLIPLIFTAGVGDGDACRVDFEDTLMGAKITGFRFS
jgi:aromatic ring-opening dioxygenase catalytic subunit (LigB family)